VKYKIEIERKGCIACGSCYSIDPYHFEPDEEGKSTVIGGENDDNASSGVFDDDEIETAGEAEDSCPTSVITVSELTNAIEVRITLPENQVKYIDELIEKETFDNRSQVIEKAIERLIEQQNKESK
jgi:ferredoxin